MTSFQNPRRSVFFRAALLMLGVFLGGCGPGRGVIFEPLEAPLFWPPPPEPARIIYVGQIETSDDLKASRSLGELIFGRDDVNTMLTPYAVCMDTRGRLLVADSNGQMVHVFDLDNRRYQQWTLEDNGRHFAQPVGILCDSLDRVLVSDSVAGTIFALDLEGKFLGELGGEHLDRPTGIAVDAVRNRLYVADAGTHQIIVLDLDGRLIDRIGRRGVEPGEFNYPTNVAVDGQGHLYVSDSLNFRIQVFDADGQPLSQFGRQGDLPGYLSHPKGIALDSENHLYIVDAQFEAVQIFKPDGTLLLTFGEEGTGPGQFWLPTGIHIDSDDRIWIADSYNRRVQVFEYQREVQP